jgi:colicin import membrane protein
MKPVVVAACLFAALAQFGPARSFAQANEAAALRDEHARIARERADAEARFGARQRECQTHFIVTSCVDDAKRDRRDILARLRREQNALDERQRKEKTAERSEEIRRKAEADAARSPPAQDTGPRESSRLKARRPVPVEADTAERPLDAASVPKPRSPRAPSKPVLGSLPKSPPRSAEDIARSRATFDAAQQEAAAHRAEVEARNAARAARRKPAAPLPLPPGASAP